MRRIALAIKIMFRKRKGDHRQAHLIIDIRKRVFSLSPLSAMSVSCRYHLSDWGSSLSFSVGRQYFLSWMDMEFCQTLFKFFCILWDDLIVSLFIMSIWYITLIDFQKLNQLWISEKNLLDHDVLSFYTTKFNLLQSKDFYSCVHVGVGLLFFFLITSFSDYHIKAILSHGTRWGVSPPVLWRNLCITDITYSLMDDRNHQ